MFHFFSDSFGRHLDFAPLLEELRAVFHTLKACNANCTGIMHAIFYPHIHRKLPFCDLSLPFDLKMKESNFCVGFLEGYPTSPVVLVREPPDQEPHGGASKDEQVEKAKEVIVCKIATNIRLDKAILFR